MDLLEFNAEELYFDETIDSRARVAVERAAELYGEPGAEEWLLRAYFLEPEHPVVLVAVYRYYYYQHRLSEALLVADRVLRVFARRLGLPDDWRELDQASFENGVMVSMTSLRFYMLALKGAGYLELRLGEHDSALARLEKVAGLDAKDRLGARALIDVAKTHLATSTPRQTAHAT